LQVQAQGWGWFAEKIGQMALLEETSTSYFSPYQMPQESYSDSGIHVLVADCV
jgi:hypothetical protein